MNQPATYIGMHLHRSVSHPQNSHLLGQLDRDLTLPAGTQLHLRRDGDGWVLQLIGAQLPKGKSLTELSLANSPRGALREDPSLPKLNAPF